MKAKLFVLTALSLAGVALSAAPASAGWLCHRCHDRCSMTLVCRPYNAFTPACSGQLVCDGCCPFACSDQGNGVSYSPALGAPLAAMHQNAIGINIATTPTPMMMQVPMTALPAPQMPINTPAPMPMTYPVAPAGYQPAMTPVYYPIMPSTMSVNPYQQVPAYWYRY